MPVVKCPHCLNAVTLPDQWASPGFLCPYCHQPATLAAPEPLPPPEPEPLPLTDDDVSPAASSTPPRQANRQAMLSLDDRDRGKSLIYFGYAAFVLIPTVAVIGLAVYKFGGEDKPNDPNDEPVVQKPNEPKQLERSKPSPPLKRTRPRPIGTNSKIDKRDDDTPNPPVPQPADSGPKTNPDPPPPLPVEVSRPTITVAIAPLPHLARLIPAVPVPEPIAIAPEPRVVRPGIAPPPGFVSDWQTIGAVEARVAGVAVKRMPITDADGRNVMSPVPVLAVWIEVRSHSTTRTIELKRLQDSFGSYAEVTTVRGTTLGKALLGPGSALRTGLPYKQVLPPDGTPRTDIVVFAAPPEGTADLRLTLDAERLGEMGKFKFSIPAKTLMH